MSNTKIIKLFITIIVLCFVIVGVFLISTNINKNNKYEGEKYYNNKIFISIEIHPVRDF